MDKSLLKFHAPLALAALFISSVIWLMARQGELESDQLTIPVVLEGVPENVEVDHTPRHIAALVKFPHNQRGRIVAQNFSIVVDLKKRLGTDPRTWGGIESAEIHRINLSLDDIMANGVPQSVRITEFVGRSQVEVQAKLQIASLPVEIRTAGELPVSSELKAPLRAEPSQVLVTAPYEVLQRVRDEEITLKTRPVDLTGRTTDFIDLPGLIVPPELELVRDSDRNVQVFVLIREKEVTRSISDVPIDLYVLSSDLKIHVEPPTAEIRLRGKISLVSQVTAASFVFSPREFLPEEAGLKKRVELVAAFDKDVPLEIREGVKIEGQMPAMVDVEFTSRANGESSAEPTNGVAPQTPGASATTDSNSTSTL